MKRAMVYARGFGVIKFKHHHTKDVRAKIEDLLWQEYQEIDSRIEEDPAEVRFHDEYYNPFRTTTAFETLTKIARLSEVKKGEVQYIGEDNALWRYIYREGKWCLENGHTEYHTITTDRVMKAFRAYVRNDAALTEPEYIRNVLTNICGLTEKELQEIGLDI